MSAIKEDYFLNKELAQLEVTAAAFAKHFIPDAKIRKEYLEQTKQYAMELQEKVAKQQLSSQKAAQ